MPPMRPVRLPLGLSSPAPAAPAAAAMGAGPAAVHCVFAMDWLGACVKMRKSVVIRSAAGSPRPEPGTELLRLMLQLTSVPLSVDELLEICSVQAPSEPT